MTQTSAVVQILRRQGVNKLLIMSRLKVSTVTTLALQMLRLKKTYKERLRNPAEYESTSLKRNMKKMKDNVHGQQVLRKNGALIFLRQ